MTPTSIALEPDLPRTISVRGMDLSEVTASELTSYLITSSKRGNGGVLLTPNLDVMRMVAKSPEAAALVSSADLRVADGVPVLWLSRMQGTPLPERVAGSDLTVTLAAALADAELSIFLVGGAPGTADGAAQRLRNMHPGLNVVGSYCPPHGYDNDPAEIAAIIERLAEARPDFVYVGLPFLKAARLARQISVALPTSWSLGVGVSFSFLTGDVQRAPRWMQRSGLEWLHRLVQEPQRLFRRYILEDLPFLATAAPGALRERLWPHSRPDVTVVHHFGPYLGEVGGMASVIQTLSGQQRGRRCDLRSLDLVREVSAPHILVDGRCGIGDRASATHSGRSPPHVRGRLLPTGGRPRHPRQMPPTPDCRDASWSGFRLLRVQASLAGATRAACIRGDHLPRQTAGPSDRGSRSEASGQPCPQPGRDSTRCGGCGHDRTACPLRRRDRNPQGRRCPERGVAHSQGGAAGSEMHPHRSARPRSSSTPRTASRSDLRLLQIRSRICCSGAGASHCRHGRRPCR